MDGDVAVILEIVNGPRGAVFVTQDPIGYPGSFNRVPTDELTRLRSPRVRGALASLGLAISSGRSW